MLYSFALLFVIFQGVGAIVELARDFVEPGRDFRPISSGKLAKLLGFLTQIADLGFAICHFFSGLL